MPLSPGMIPGICYIFKKWEMGLEIHGSVVEACQTYEALGSIFDTTFFFLKKKKSLAGTNIIWVNTHRFLGAPRINQLFGMLNTVF